MPTQTSSVLHNDTVSSCLTSKVQEKTQLSRSRCMNSLREIKSQFKFLTETLQDFGTMPIFKRTFSQDLDLIEQHLTKDILSQTDCNTTLIKLRLKLKNAFNSEFKERMQKYTRFNAQSFQDAMIFQALNVDSLKADLVVIQNTCSEKEDSNLETTSNKSVNESSLDSATKDVHYDRRVNKRQMQTQESKTDMGKALDAKLVVIESSGTKLEVQDDTSRSGNDTDADDTYIKPIYDEEPMAEIQEKVFAIAALKNKLRKLKGNSVDTKFAKTSVLGKLVLQSLRNQSVVRQSNAFKSERPQISKPRFASQVDVKNDLSKPVTQHYLSKRRESVFAKPKHMIPSRSSRNSSKNMPRFSSNYMVHNHYLDEARKKTQERDSVGIKSILDAVWITVAHVFVNTAQLELVLLMNFKENMLSVYYC
ncbi:hypothetical protein Tco_1254259 [Tanacetum coccineum]